MMRRSNTFIGIVALGVIAVVVVLRLHQGRPVPPRTTRSRPRSRPPTACARAPSCASPGVDVGKVVKRRARVPGSAQRRGHADRREGRPMHKDAPAKIRPRIFLEGNFFVDLQPGTPGPGARGRRDASRPRRPRRRSSSTRCSVARSPTRARTSRSRSREYGDGLDGAGAARLQPLDPYWESAYRDSAIVADAHARRAADDLSGYVRDAGTVADAIDRHPRQLKTLITDFNATAARVRRERRRLEAASASCRARCAPRCRRCRAQRARSRRCGADRRPAARACATPGRARRRAPVRARAARPRRPRPSCAAWPPTCARGPRPRASPSATIPLLGAGPPRLGCQNEVILPWSQGDGARPRTSPPRGPIYQEAAKFLPGLAGESRSGDANGQWFKVLAAGGTNIFELERRRLRATPLRRSSASTRRKPERRPPLRPDVPCETQEKPDLRTRARPAAEQRQIDTAHEGLPGALRQGARDGDRVARAASSSRRALRTGSPLATPTPTQADDRQAEAGRPTASRTDARRTSEARDPQPRQGLRRDRSGCSSSPPSSSRLHPRPAAAALPVVEDEPLRSRPSSRPPRPSTAGPGPDRRGSPACGSATSATSSSRRPRDRRDGRRPRRTRASSTTDATALLRPKTGLKDMFVDLDPGHATTRRRPRRTSPIPIQNTPPDVNPDEIFSALDADTRDYLQLLVDGAGRGLDGPRPRPRGVSAALRADPPRPRPGHLRGGQAARATCGGSITSLEHLNGELAARDDDLARLVDSSAAVFAPFAAEESNVSAAVGELPGRAAADDHDAGQGRALRQRAPPGRRATAAGRARAGPGQRGGAPVRATETTPLLRDEIRPFVREARPLVARPAAAPRQTSRRRRPTSRASSRSLNHLSTCSPTTRTARGPGQGVAPGGLPVLDRLGPAQANRCSRAPTPTASFRPVTLVAPCETLKHLVARARARVLSCGLTPILADPALRMTPLMQKSAPLRRPASPRWWSSRCRASACCCSCGSSFGGPVPLKPKGYRFQVAFPEAATLATEADVRDRRRAVGKVAQGARPRRQPHAGHDRARAAFAPMRKDTRAILRQKTLLGETYVELTPGARRRELDEGGRLADARVAETVSSTRSSTPSTRPRARRSARGSRTWRRSSSAAARTSTTRSAPCPASPPRRRRVRRARLPARARSSADQEHRRRRSTRSPRRGRCAR